MEKKISKALIISLVASLLFALAIFAIEGISAYKYNKMPICREVWGGECKEYQGIGWNVIELFPMTDANSPVSAHSDDARIFFNRNILGLFIVSWIITFAISCLIIVIRKKFIREK